jgi:hypothetical protein
METPIIKTIVIGITLSMLAFLVSTVVSLLVLSSQIRSSGVDSIFTLVNKLN